MSASTPATGALIVPERLRIRPILTPPESEGGENSSARAYDICLRETAGGREPHCERGDNGCGRFPPRQQRGSNVGL